MLKSINVKNYRTFAEETEINIAPITILLGANSSGKSSITRLFPLLNQSLSARLSAPILWVSDILDYGSFEANVHRYNKDEPIVIGFKCEANQSHTRRAYGSGYYVEINPGKFEYKIHISAKSSGSYISAIEYVIFDEKIKVTIGEDDRVSSVNFRGKDYRNLVNGKTIYILPGTFPTFFAVDKNGEMSVNAIRDAVYDASKILRRYAHQNMTDENIYQKLSAVSIGSFDQTIARVRGRFRDKEYLFRRFEYISDDELDRIWLALFISSINTIMSSCESVVSADIAGGSYLAPIRAQASRYYRRQDLAVDQIDPAGVNLAMYINSLNAYELRMLNEDLSNFFDHRVELHKGEGHISIRLEEEGESVSDNLADVGFGFSQLLPVIAQVHAAGRGKARPQVRNALSQVGGLSPILAIEQPELHLHPAYQAKLGQYFASAAKAFMKRPRKCRFVIETHSEQLVNEIASMVGRGELSPSDVKIYLFAREVGDRVSDVVEADIKQDGTIPNWPFGFFTSGRIKPSGLL